MLQKTIHSESNGKPFPILSYTFKNQGGKGQGNLLKKKPKGYSVFYDLH